MDQPSQHRDVYAYIGSEIPTRPMGIHRSLLLFIRDTFHAELPRIEAELYWCNSGEPPLPLGTTLIIPVHPQKSIGVDENQVERVIPLKELEQIVGLFATFIGSRRGYRLLIDAAGQDLSKRLLSKANDAAALQAFSRNSRILKSLRSSGLLKSILVSEEQQFSFLSLQKIFAERDSDHTLPPDIKSFSTQISIDCLTTFKFISDYEEVLGETQPVTAVIGANGAGKTRLLLALADAALRGRLDIRTSGQQAPSSRMHEAADVLSFTYERALWSKLRRAGARVINLGVGAREWTQLSTVFQQLAIFDRNEFQINAYIQVIAAIVDPHDLLVPIADAAEHSEIVHIGAKNYLPLPALARYLPRALLGQLETGKDVLAYSPRLGPYSLSSGQRSLLLLIAQLFLHGERSLVLIDEPENHLHPQFITLLMQTLQSTLVAMESRAVVATHSPFVIRELDKTAVQILDKDKGEIPCIYQTSLQTFGADVGRISEYVFGDHAVHKGYERRIKRALEAVPAQSVATRAQQVASVLGDDAELYLHRLLSEYGHAD